MPSTIDSLIAAAESPEASTAVVWAAIGAIVTAVTMAAGIAAKVWPLLRRIGYLLDDLLGEPARPGVPPRPGMMVRQLKTEKTLDVLVPAVARTQPDGGAALTAALLRIDSEIAKSQAS